MRIPVSLAFLLALAACAAPPSNDLIEHALGESFSAPAGRLVMVDQKVTVSFMDVVEDSRCPKQVTCVWQGVAKIKVGAVVHEGPGIEHQEFILATTPDTERAATIQGYRVELMDVTPWPETPGRMEIGRYGVTLRVTREP